MITDYKVLCKISRIDIVDEVKKLMSKGWTPLGGIAVDDFKFYQTMIKEEKQT